MRFFRKCLQMCILYFWLFLWRIEGADKKTAPFARKRLFAHMRLFILRNARLYTRKGRINME